jgi:xanthine dehydrogenase YagR molybdenum-binding subunit
MTSHAPYPLDGPQPETPEPAAEPDSWQQTTVVGKPIPRIDAYHRVSGTATYPSDVILPDMLYGAILRCPHAHARVLEVDTGAAARMPGVAAILAPGSPEAETGWRYGRFATTILDPLCRYEGEAVAAVAAETPDQARDALRAITVEYQQLPFVADETTALADGAPAVHEGGNQVGEPSRYQRGDVDRGFSEADVVLEASYRTECEIHNPLERHGCVARWEGDRLTVWESTQGVFTIQAWLAAILGLPLANVRVICPYMGGGFGSKLQPGKYTVIAALLARKTARPVKLILSREECMLAVGNRPPSNMWLKAGVKRDGTLTALDFKCTGTGGAYPTGGTSLVDWEVKDLYTCPNVSTECTDVYINAGPARPFRAPGHPQGAWALEQMIDALAEAIGMDPIALRLKNIPAVSQANEGSPPYTSTGLRQCLEEGAQAFGWQEARSRTRGNGTIRRGVGVAAAHWAYGGGWPPTTVIVKMYSDGSVNLNLGASDLGTGTRTVMAMVVAEELGLQLDQIQVENADTGTTQFASSSGGSKTVPTEAPATRAAAAEVKRQLLEIAAEEMETDTADLALEDGSVVSRSNPEQKKALTELRGLQRRSVVIGVGYRGPNPEGKIVNPFTAQLCEVEVNMRTGEVTVLRFVAAHDSGRMMNQLTFSNQVCGGINMGIGLAMTEARVLDRKQTGKTVNRNLHDYKLPTALDVPAEVTPVVIDLDDHEANSTGAKGLGEPVTIPTAAVIANAVYNATGVRVTTTPINPTRLCRLLADAGKEG